MFGVKSTANTTISKQYTEEFKAAVALEALKGESSLQELAAKHGEKSIEQRLKTWISYYNSERLHSSLGNKTPEKWREEHQSVA